MALISGTRLGPYQILAPIGAGGMGEVYKAKDTRLDRTVAIKVLPEHLAESPERKARFEREAKAISQLNHPHICTLYDVGEQDGVDFIVMAYIEGETLAERLKKGALPLDKALEYGIQIADGLDTAHRAGIVHRDLKPPNVMLTKSGVKLLDFGLAKLVEGDDAPETSDAPTRQKDLTKDEFDKLTFRSWPSAKKPIHEPSGEKKGCRPPAERSKRTARSRCWTTARESVRG